MKHLRNLIMLLAMLCMTLTSCLNSNSEDYTPTGYGLVEVVSYMGQTCFKASNGTLIYPTAQSLATVETSYSFIPSSTKMAYIGYEYSSDIDFTASKSVTVTLTYAVSVDGTSEVVYEEGAENDSVATAPIISLTDVMTTTGTSAMYLMNNRYLVTGVNYYFYQYAHYLTLVCYDDEQDDDTVLKLHLRHSGTVESTSIYTTSYDAYTSGYPFIYLKAFDIDEFPLTPSTKTIQVTADVASENVPLASASKKVYTVAYSAE